MTVLLKFARQMLSGQNQFASGGLLLMIVGAVGVYLRSLPLRLWSWLTYQCTMLLTVNDDDTAFEWMKEWFLEQPFLRKVRWLDVDTSLRGDEASLIPAPGRHRFWYGGRPFWVWFTRKEDTVGWTPRRMESLTFRTIGRDTKILERFVSDVVTCHKSKLRKASYLYQYDERWCYVHAYAPRRLESVILKAKERDDLVNDIRQFQASRERYSVLGVPYHRGYLLYGLPGTGKTSLVSGLAAEFGMSVYAINLTELNDQKLKRAVSTVPENCVILFEDIDCMKVGGRKPQVDDENKTSHVAEGAKSDLGDRHGVTLSGLLNVLDGLHAPENVLFLMTTNKIEALDAALLRPGRIDYRLYMGRATEEQKIELYRRFFPLVSMAEAQIFVERHGHAETMAEFQGLLLAMEDRIGRPGQSCLEFEEEVSEAIAG
ncbi:MAG TPA: AAA family ATPase [Terriglobales bacterium]|nr:AAA family ATPase [Terriglobales bacterium]